jgi:hypothetical protein
MRVVSWHESGAFSAKRDYFRIQRYNYIYDVCAAPFGGAFFISARFCVKSFNFWLFAAQFPFISWFALPLLRLFNPETYYKIDSALMYSGVIEAALFQVIDEMTTSQGLDRLPEYSRRPIMRELYGDKGRRAPSFG